ncbi:cryptochrome/photolyase family protein [Paenibacillus sp. GCM10012303]|jgi:deoxyribodipyrimidine photo-lyase|uniref:cryptochrome/photolyase family protein n=1 Tax=Paenibacillus sp. GCM10012303 TaxID=3317340 RepID=UPI00361D4AC9
MILFVHRKDLRVTDMPAFAYIARTGLPSLHLFILDPAILNAERARAHSGRRFLGLLARLQSLYRHHGQTLNLVCGTPEEIVPQIALVHEATEVVFHRDDTPYARHRDTSIHETLHRLGIPLTTISDQPLADPEELHRYAGRQSPYKVFTPFYRKWSEFVHTYFQPPVTTRLADLRTLVLDESIRQRYAPPYSLERFRGDVCLEAPEERLERFIAEKLPDYAQRRDSYAGDATSGLSGYINSGSISVRTVYDKLLGEPDFEAWKRQLAWRDFYLYQSVFDPLFFEYEHYYDLSGLGDRHFEAWRKGRTGIPIVDAAMTQLNETGSMPNRLRMVTAMFLTKNLLAPFTLGEQTFRMMLTDADNVLNRGGWLWSASLGYDAAPYFRIMNPVTQSETWDPSGEYIRRWLPGQRGLSDRDVHRPLPHAVVDLKASRARAIEVYKRLIAEARARIGVPDGQPGSGDSADE